MVINYKINFVNSDYTSDIKVISFPNDNVSFEEVINTIIGDMNYEDISNYKLANGGCGCESINQECYCEIVEIIII